MSARFEDVIGSLGEMPLAVSNIYALSHVAGQPIRVVVVMSSGRRIMIQADLWEEFEEIGYLVASDEVPIDPAGYEKQPLSAAGSIENITSYVVSGCPYPARVTVKMAEGVLKVSADGFAYGVSYASGKAQAGTPQFDDAEYSEVS